MTRKSVRHATPFPKTFCPKDARPGATTGWKIAAHPEVGLRVLVAPQEADLKGALRIVVPVDLPEADSKIVVPVDLHEAALRIVDRVDLPEAASKIVVPVDLLAGASKIVDLAGLLAGDSRIVVPVDLHAGDLEADQAAHPGVDLRAGLKIVAPVAPLAAGLEADQVAPPEVDLRVDSKIVVRAPDFRRGLTTVQWTILVSGAGVEAAHPRQIPLPGKKGRISARVGSPRFAASLPRTMKPKDN